MQASLGLFKKKIEPDISAKIIQSEEKLDKIQAINQMCYELNSMIECSKAFGGIPAFTNINPIKTQKKKYQKLPNPDNALQAFKFCLPNMRFPRIQSIEQVLRLREDKRIIKFREKILEWTEYLSEGDIKSEERVRKDIRKANKELSKINTAQKVSTFSTILSVPAFFADLIFSGGAIGGTLLVGSIGSLCYEYTKKKQYEWLLFGT
jgi:hypothetical protein